MRNIRIVEVLVSFTALTLLLLPNFSCSSSSSMPQPSVVHAAPSCINFQSTTSNPDIHGEGVCQVPGTANVYTLFGEMVFSGTTSGTTSATLALSFPPNKTITELNGTLSYYSNCPWGPTLTPPTGAGNVVLVRVYTSSDPGNPGLRVPSYSWVMKNSATSGQTVFIDDHIPIPTGDGNGGLTAFTLLPVVSPACFLTVEFQGHMIVQ